VLAIDRSIDRHCTARRKFGERTTLDIAFPYSDLGEARSDRGRMAMNTAPDGIVIDRIETDLRIDGLLFGLRYRL